MVQGAAGKCKNYCRWSKLFDEVIQSQHQGLFSFPKVFIYLMDGTKPISFWKGDITQFQDPNPSFRWVSLQIDKALSKIEGSKAGFLSFKLYVRPLEDFDG